jgi:hypothetical protein
VCAHQVTLKCMASVTKSRDADVWDKTDWNSQSLKEDLELCFMFEVERADLR